MGFRLLNRKQISEYLLAHAIRIEKALIYQLEYLVAELENHAKVSAGYKDQTSNLKGSIGGVVLKNGKPITYRGFEGGGEVGNKTGLEFINELISQFAVGYAIIIVAGMEYATYVENYHGLNVLKKTELRMQREIPIMLNNLKARLQ